MRVSIYSIQQTLYESDAEKLIAKTPTGEIAVLENHLPIISKVLGPEIRVVDKKGILNMIKCTSGFLEVRPDRDGHGIHAVVLAE